jgi:hypothetical protein
VIQIVQRRGLDLTKVLDLTKALDLPAPLADAVPYIFNYGLRVMFTGDGGDLASTFGRNNTLL